MDDDTIVSLYWKRDESAISATEKKYGRYLLKIAYNILNDREDSKESVNDTYLKAWNSMPPHKPIVLSTYLGKITRQVSIDIFRTKNRDKRRLNRYSVSLSELYECIPSGDKTDENVNLQLLSDAINDYLHDISAEARTVFVCRYYYFDSVKDISSHCGMSESKVKSLLYRARIGLKEYLKKEGFTT
jgi:RNA polymerase sigma-70 factor (ECF subfamily)